MARAPFGSATGFPDKLAFQWQRFWVPRTGSIDLSDGGFLMDPTYFFRSGGAPAQQLAELPYRALALLGEPGIGKSTTLSKEATRLGAEAVDGVVSIYVDLRAYSSETLLHKRIFESPEFLAWAGGTSHLFLHLDSLDEALLRIDSIANLLADELPRNPTARLSVRIACRGQLLFGMYNAWSRRTSRYDMAVGVRQRLSAIVGSHRYQFLVLGRDDAANAKLNLELAWTKAVALRFGRAGKGGFMKRIVVFADGTGNAFSTQESNVWRLYQALDRSEADQIAYYIKGVGTSGFRPFALLDGATGIGVPSNVRKLYEFICWNWQPGDQICMFGFSRGSFTIRTLIGLIHYEGLVPREIEGEAVSRHEMLRNVMAAWRSYRSKTIPNSLLRVSPIIPIARVIRNIFVGVAHTLFGHRGYKQICRETQNQNRAVIPIRFAGLFDTVEAFGVPIEEFRRAINWAIWPISFRNAKLSTRVEQAFHALSLDEERTTFHPLRFDMRGDTTDRIKEVWFAGVHSDVGGGYPDSDLEHVPLVWIASHAVEQGGVRLTPGALDAFREAASAVGPRHDSRDGLGVFYRYGPRVINDSADDGGPPVIHHSVAERMVFGCDGYAPIVLPSTAEVLLPDGSKHTISGFVTEERMTLAPPDPAMTRALAAVRAIRDPDPYIVSLVRDHVWWRRTAYFALLGTTIVAVSLPWTAAWLTSYADGAGSTTAEAVGAGSLWPEFWGALVRAAGSITAVLLSLLALIGNFIPGYAKPWVNILTSLPITCLVVVAAVLILYRTNGYLRDRIADLARQAWFPSRRERGLTSDETTHEPKRTFARFMRRSLLVNLVQRAVADYLLPSIGIVAIYFVVFVALVRSLVSVYEGRGDICKLSAGAQPLVPGQVYVLEKKFETHNECWASGVKLEIGRTYTIRLKMEEPYFDSAIMSDIAGFEDPSWRHRLALPFRRWWSAAWFQPVARIGALGDVQWKLESMVGDAALPVGTDRAGNSFDPHFFTDPLFADRLEQIRRDKKETDPADGTGAYRILDKDMSLASTIWATHKFQNQYVSEFVARANGELFLYVNDVLGALPFWGPLSRFYENNRGTATVSIVRRDYPAAVRE